jgi:hypothetical protein
MRRTVAFAVVASLASACGAPTPGLSNGSVSACYRAIPAGRQAIHDPAATLIGVHRIPADRVRARLPKEAQVQLANDNDTTVCAISFKGRFSPGQVDLAPPGESGSYAVVLVSSRKLRLIDAAVLHHLPRALGRRTL